MKGYIKKNLPLIAGLSLPVVMIIAVAAAIYLPRFYAPKPSYNFIYFSFGNGPYALNSTYTVVNGRIANPQNNYPPPIYNPTTVTAPQLYEYNAQSGKATPISFQQAYAFQLDPSATSPDGYQIVTGASGGFPLFQGGADLNSRYLKGHGTSFPLDLEYIPPGNNYSNFQFLGWIIK